VSDREKRCLRRRGHSCPSGQAPRGRSCCVWPAARTTKHCWHIEANGRSGCSFGEHLAATGYIVIAVDHPGIGESTDPLVASGSLGLELLASGDAEVTRQVRRGLQRGDIFDAVPPVDVPRVGIGHSMGACPTTIVQAKAGVYDAVALLGYAVQITDVYEHTADAADLESRVQQSVEAACQLTGTSPEASRTIALGHTCATRSTPVRCHSE
jgi:alpha-beta hydrolase superfamily lysophospholipase